MPTMRHDVPFLEMGFDSLFLTQASLRIKSEFKVRVTFRQLFEDAPTIAAAGPLHRRQDAARAAVGARGAEPRDRADDRRRAAPDGLLQDRRSRSATHPSLPARLASARVSSTTAGLRRAAGDASALERVVHEQLRLMAEQLRLLGRARRCRAVQPAGTAFVRRRRRAPPCRPLRDRPRPPALQRHHDRAALGAGEAPLRRPRDPPPHSGRSAASIGRRTDSPRASSAASMRSSPVTTRKKASKALTASQRARARRPARRRRVPQGVEGDRLPDRDRTLEGQRASGTSTATSTSISRRASA